MALDREVSPCCTEARQNVQTQEFALSNSLRVRAQVDDGGMGEAGDWDPLPPETLEDAEELARQKAAAERRAAEAEGERRLRAMIAGARGGEERPALSQAISKMAQRQDRRQAAARAPFAAEARHRTSFLQPADVPLEPDYEEGRDPREDEEWFRKLPADMQEKYRERWQWEATRFDPLAEQARRRLLVTLYEGAAVFVVVDFLLGMLLGWRLIDGLVMALAGAGCGLLWHLLRADRFGHALFAMPVYLFAHLVLLGTWNPFRLFFGVLVLVHAASYRGLRVEHRKLEGTW